MATRSWTASEIETLRRMAALGTNVSDIARALERSHEAIKARARLLGLDLDTIIGRPGARPSAPADGSTDCQASPPQT